MEPEIGYSNKVHTYSADTRLVEAVEAIGQCEGMSKSEVIREAVAYWLKARGITKAEIFTQPLQHILTRYRASHAQAVAMAAQEVNRPTASYAHGHTSLDLSPNRIVTDNDEG